MKIYPDSSVCSSSGQLRSPSVTNNTYGTLSSRHHEAFSSSFEKNKHLEGKRNHITHHCTTVLCVCFQLTSVGDDCAEGEVIDAPFSADRGPRRQARTVVLHHQRETVPGEVRSDMLLTHQHTHTVAHAGGTGWECENTLFNIQ